MYTRAYVQPCQNLNTRRIVIIHDIQYAYNEFSYTYTDIITVTSYKGFRYFSFAKLLLDNAVFTH